MSLLSSRSKHHSNVCGSIQFHFCFRRTGPKRYLTKQLCRSVNFCSLHIGFVPMFWFAETLPTLVIVKISLKETFVNKIWSQFGTAHVIFYVKVITLFTLYLHKGFDILFLTFFSFINNFFLLPNQTHVKEFNRDGQTQIFDLICFLIVN